MKERIGGERQGDFTDNFNELSNIYLHLIQNPFNMIKW